MFGAGYVAAEDRLFFMDASATSAAPSCRRSRRTEGNLGTDRATWALHSRTPMRTSRSSTTGGRRPSRRRGRAGRSQTSQNYVDGINQDHRRGRSGPRESPASTRCLDHPAGPDAWKVTDVGAVASLVGGQFGKGGGDEVNSALALEAALAKFGDTDGHSVWEDFRERDDAEAPTTVHSTRFPYGGPGDAGQRGAARPGHDRQGAGDRKPRSAEGQGPGAAREPRRRRRHVECPPRLQRGGPGKSPPRRHGPTGRLLLAADPDRGGPPRSHDARRRRARCPWRRVRGAQPLRAARPGPGLRLERDLGRPGHHRHVRGGAVRPRATPGNPAAIDDNGLPPRGSAARSRCSSSPTPGRPTPADSTPAGSYTLRTLRTDVRAS